MALARSARPFDLVLFGATGYTGRLVAERLARRCATRPLRWALAGRDRAKLERVRDDLATLAPDVPPPGIPTGDALDGSAMRAIAAETRIVCTTVGPYLRYGGELVAACAEHGTDYCDLTGEVPFIRSTIDAHHETAQRTGARIVHCCGFDSIPSDLGVLFLQQEMRRRYGRPAKNVTALVSMRGGPSGGTVASVLGIIEQAIRDPATRRLLGNPYALDPDPSRRGRDGADARFVGYVRCQHVFTAPFVMAGINTRVVRRSHALLGYPYGEDFQYREVTSVPATPRGLVAGLTLSVGLAGFVAAAAEPALRRRLERRLPAPGQGPTPEERERGHYRLRFIGEIPGEPAMRMVAEVSDRGDPGYASTSKMLSEAALCLALDELPSNGGVLTPAVCMGLTLIERLRPAGMTFKVVEE
jgi:short subunit dehydrogenase-like uncharacterized protein